MDIARRRILIPVHRSRIEFIRRGMSTPGRDAAGVEASRAIKPSRLVRTACRHFDRARREMRAQPRTSRAQPSRTTAGHLRCASTAAFHMSDLSSSVVTGLQACVEGYARSKLIDDRDPDRHRRHRRRCDTMRASRVPSTARCVTATMPMPHPIRAEAAFATLSRPRRCPPRRTQQGSPSADQRRVVAGADRDCRQNW